MQPELAAVTCSVIDMLSLPLVTLLVVLFLSIMTGSMAAQDSKDTEWGRAIYQDSTSDTTCDANIETDLEQVDVAIIGGGLVGLALAIGLSRKTMGRLVIKVYERAPQLRSVSQGILSIQPNGMAALESIHPDLPQLIMERGCERWQFVNTTIKADGIVEETVNDKAGKEAKAQYGRVKVGMTWHRMQQLLASLLPSRDMIETGHSLVSYQEEEDSVVLFFEDKRAVRAKIVLGCDGVFSAVRRQMVQDRPIYFGQLNWGTVIESSKLPLGLHPPNAVHYFYYQGEPRWMAMINDGGSGYTFFQFRISDPIKAMALSGSSGRGGLGLPGIKQALLPVAQPSRQVASAIEAIPEAQIFERSIMGRLPASTWLSPGKRIALVGDAAHGMHPNIGQGANSAFESASALLDAVDVESSNGDLRPALAAYEEHRKPRADLVQRFANMMGCVQATGASLLSREDVVQVMDWIISNGGSEKYPSRAAVDLINSFDPLSHPGVSMI